ncbi:MAG: hypothetical protein RR425_04395, partial [Erysipelotrichales bacterium]
MRFKYIQKGNKNYYIDTKEDYGSKLIPNIFSLNNVDFDGYQVDEQVRPTNTTRKFNVVMKILVYLALASFPIVFIIKDSNNLEPIVMQAQVIIATLVLMIVNFVKQKRDNIDEHLIVSKSNRKVTIKVKYKDRNVRLGLLVVFVGLIITTLVSLSVSAVYWSSIDTKYFQVILGPASLVFSIFFYLHAFYYLNDLEYNLVKRDKSK